LSGRFLLATSDSVRGGNFWPGASGLIAAQAAAGVEKDGYSLYVAQASTFFVLPVE
jgi:hypothetical protein